MADADAARVTHCQLEAHVHYASLVSHEPEGAACHGAMHGVGVLLGYDTLFISK